MSLTKEQVAEMLANQQKLIEMLTKQQDAMLKQQENLDKQLKEKPKPASVINVAEVVSQPAIQIDNFNPKAEKFSCYLLRLRNCFDMRKLTNDNDADVVKQKSQILINSIGSKYVQLLMNLTAPDDPRNKKFDELVALLESHLSPAPNIFSEQHKFLSRNQGQNETIADYVSALQEISMTCDWSCPNSKCSKPITSTIIKAQFIRGIKDSEIREKLLQLPDQKSVSFEKLVETAQTIEISKSDNKIIYQTDVKSNPVNKIGDNQGRRGRQNTRQSRSRYSSRSRERDRTSRRNRSQSSKRKIDFKELGIDDLCFRCARNNHRTRNCRIPPEKLSCKSCNKSGHVEKVCISSLLKQKRGDKVDQLSESEEDIQSIHCITDHSNKIIIPVQINGKSVSLECDSGSRRTVISKQFFKSLNLKTEIYQDNTKFRDYTNHIFKPIGYVCVNVKFKDRCIKNARMYITDKSNSSVMGREWILPLKIISFDEVHSLHQPVDVPDVEEIIRNIKLEFEDVFKEGVIGKVKDYVVDFDVREGTVPIYKKARKIPFELRPAADKCIDRYIEQGILEPVTTSEWGTTAIFVEKADGSVRLVGNYKQTINPFLPDNVYPMRTIEEVFNEIGGKVYCRVDLTDAYLHLPVSLRAAILQTLVTYRGTFRVNRMFFGPKVAPKEWAKFIDKVVKGLLGVLLYFDDAFIYGDTIEECLQRLREFLQRLRQYDLHANLKKCDFFKQRIQYLGHVIDAEGIHKSQSKIDAIKKARRPTNADEVKIFTGLVNYYAKFIKNSSNLLYPLNRLTRKGVPFYWSKECENSFNKIKEIIASDQVLYPYKRELPLLLATDASPHGISAVLSHRMPDGSERPVAFASRSLTKAEERYSQLDREALALYWGTKKFYYYVYGRKFTYIIDNKPLMHILNPNKDLPAHTASRMLRYAAFLQSFDFNIEYKSSKEHANADYCSRFPIKYEEEEIKIVDEFDSVLCDRINTITSFSPITSKRIADETNRDPELSKLKKELINGKNNEPEYTLYEDIIFKNGRVFVPEKLRPDVLAELHETHLGVVKMKALARKYVYWPRIDSEIESIVKSCINCANQSKNPAKVPLHKWETPKENFQRVHMDYAGPFQNHHFFVIIDAKSKWLEVYTTKSAPTTETTIHFLHDFISRFGAPDELVSDNASIFRSAEFEKFVEFYGINQRLIAPGHPQTNGQAERAVQFLKSKLKKSENTTDTKTLRKIISSILLRYRTTPLEIENGKTPAELVFGRNIKTRLDLIIPAQSKDVKKSNLKIKTFRLGDRVQSRNYTSSTLWKFGTIVEKLGKLHYIVELDDGYTIKRHVDQLRATEVSKPIKNEIQPKKVSFVQPKTQITEQKIDLNINPQPDVRMQTSSTQRPVQPQPQLRRSTRSRREPNRLTY